MRNYSEVFNSIVILNSIKMMNFFAITQRSFKMPRHYKAMLHNITRGFCSARWLNHTKEGVINRNPNLNIAIRSLIPTPLPQSISKMAVLYSLPSSLVVSYQLRLGTITAFTHLLNPIPYRGYISIKMFGNHLKALLFVKIKVSQFLQFFLSHPFLSHINSIPQTQWRSQ